MRTFIIVQVLMIAGIVRGGEEATTVVQDTRTAISIEEINGLSRYHRDDYDYFDRPNEADSDLDFDYEEEPHGNYPPLSKEHLMKEAMLKAMKKPSIREQIGEVIPILRAMSPTQRLTLAALVSSQIMSQGRLSEANLTEMATMFAGNNVANVEDRQNITEHLLLPISMDIAKIFRGIGKDTGRSLRIDNSELHNMRKNYRKRYRRKNYHPMANRRMDVVAVDLNAEERRQKLNTTKEIQNLINEGVLQPSVNDCEYFSSSFCLEVTDYPLDAIIKSVERHQGIRDTLLEDFRIQQPEANGEGRNPEKTRMRRRQDTGGNEIRDAPKEEYMCPSSVKYARPKRARTTSGQWKYVVNAGDYTQTLRLEMCLKPMAPCSYVTSNYHSQCTQVYNYHRLLTWEENKGLHMDIFKVPSCCSCHIQGYNTFYPPGKDFLFAEKRREPISLRPSYSAEPPEIQLYANPSIKREIVRPIPLQPTTTPLNFVQRETPKEPQTPLYHLIPPGPPLPLEGESIKFRSEVNFHKKRGSGEHRRIAEVGPHKLEIGEPIENRIRYRTSQSEKSSVVFHPTDYRGKTTEEFGIFATSKPTTEKILRKTPYLDSFVRKTTAATTATTTSTTTTTTTAPTVPKSVHTSNGRKKINYNYHPIIEFFLNDYVNTTSQQYSKPFTSALTTHEWTPVIGRGKL